MAEVLGVVASAIAVTEVAVKAGGAIPKLKALWDEVQNVPETIQDLLRQIEIFDDMIQEMETRLDDVSSINHITFNDTAMQRRTQNCRESLQNLSKMVDDMSMQIQNQKNLRRSLAKARVVLKKKALEELEARLQKALKLLHFTQLNYTMVLQKYTVLQLDGITSITRQTHRDVKELKKQHLESGQPQVAVELHTNDNSDSEREAADVILRALGGSSSRKEAKQALNKSRWTGHFGLVTVIWRVSERKLLGGHRTNQSLRLRLPLWFLKTSWEIQLSKSLGGPTVGLRAWRVVPWDSPAFEAVGDGDMKALVRSLETGQSTLYDRTLDGATLLHKAVQARRIEFVQLLQASGLKVNELNDYGHSALELIGYGEWTNPKTALNEKQISAWHGTLVPENALDEEVAVYCCGFVAMILNNRIEETLELLLRHDFDNTVLFWTRYHLFVTTSLWFKPEPLRHSWFEPVPSGAFAFALGNKKVLKYMLREGVVGDLAFVIGKRSWPLLHPETADWEIVLKEVLGHGDFDQKWLHSTQNSRRFTKTSKGLANYIAWHWEDATPLVFLLQGYCVGYHYQNMKLKHKGLANALKYWLQLLQQNGVDLVTYGRQECQLIQQSQPELGIFCLKSFTWGSQERLLDIRYGPDPQDWHLIWDLDVEQMAGEFWTSMQEPEFVMPGQWVGD